MVGLLIGLTIFLAIGGAVGWVIFFRVRQVARENKSFERGLKMVPLLIHLPPPSDDTEVGGRDTRDVVDETISRAQTIYNIIGSTYQKGFKAKYYGQRHFAFEIVANGGFVNFYAAVPVAMVEVIKQAIVSAYPAARLEETSEHNIFNQVGKLSAVAGGEMNLKEQYAYPIATYQDIKRDALQSVLNSLSTLEKEDGAAIQIVLRPAQADWRKAANTLASNKRKGKDKKQNPFQLFIQFLSAFSKPPEDKKDGGDKKELSNLEQSNLDAIDEKTRHVGYDTQIRIVVSSNISQRAQALVSNVVASFSLFDAPGKNGFKFTPSKDPAELVSNYNLRAFTATKKLNVLNAVELSTLFHFPDQRNIPTTQVVRQDSKQVDGPRNVPDEGLFLGYNEFRGVKKPIRIAAADRARHMYAVGQTGTGKSTFLENLAFQDMLAGNGFAFVDPHGDTAEKLLAMIPKERTEDLIYFSPADMDHPLGLNLFEFDDPDQKDFLIQETLNMLQKLYDPTHQGIMGPRYEHIFRNAALLVMADPAGGTFVDIPKLFRDPQFLKQKLQHVTDNTVREFWEKEYPASQRSNDAGEVTSWFVSKFGAFLSNEMMRNIIGQTQSAFNLRDIMDNKKILLVNLSKGRTGDLNSKLLGMIFVMKFQAAAMSRANIPEDQRVDFSLYVDEFQNFSTDSFATIMSEARKYHLNLIVANQFTTQLTPEIRDAVFGNMGTIVSFRIGQNDVEAISKYFQPTFDADDLLRVPNHNSIIRTLIGGVPTQPFSMAMLPPLGNPNPKLADALKQLSAAKYGRPRASVEKDIFSRLATKPEARPAFSAPAGAGPAPANRPGPTGTGNFLDEWMAKRPAGQTTAQPKAPAPQFASQAPTAAPAPTQTMPMQAPQPFQTTPAVQPTQAAPQPAANPAPEPAPVATPKIIASAPALQPAAPEAEVDSVEDKPTLQGAQPSSADAIMREHSAANAEQTSAQTADVHNISSAENESDEIAKIASELRQNLGMDGVEAAKPHGGERVIQPPKHAKQPDIQELAALEEADEAAQAAKDENPAVSVDEAPVKPAEEDAEEELTLPPKRPQTAQEPEKTVDTIKIDDQGNIISNDDSTAS